MRFFLTSWPTARRFWRQRTTAVRFLLALLLGSLFHFISSQFVQLLVLRLSSNSLQTVATEWYEKFSNQLEPVLNDVEEVSNQINQDENLQKQSFDKVDFQRPKFYTDEIEARQRLLVVRMTNEHHHDQLTPLQLSVQLLLAQKLLLATLNNQTLLVRDAVEWPMKLLINQKLHTENEILISLIRVLSEYYEPHAAKGKPSLLEEYKYVLILTQDKTQINPNALEKFLMLSKSLPTHFFAHGLNQKFDQKVNIIKWIRTYGMLASSKLLQDCATNLQSSSFSMTKLLKKVDKKTNQFFSCLLKHGQNVSLPSVDYGNFVNRKLLQAPETVVFHFNLKDKIVYWQLQKQFLHSKTQILTDRLITNRNQLYEFQMQHFTPKFPADIEPIRKSPTRFDVIPFQMLNETHAFYFGELQNVRLLHDFEIMLQKQTHTLCLQHLRRLEHLHVSMRLQAKLLHTYRKLEPTTGETLLLDFLYRLDNNFYLCRCKSVRQLLPPVLLQNIESNTAKVRNSVLISVITIVSDLTDAKNLIQFLKQFVKFCLSESVAFDQNGQPLRRLWILFQYAGDEDDQWPINPSGWSDPYQEAKVLALQLHGKHNQDGVWIRFLNLRTVFGRIRVLGHLACADVLIAKFAKQLHNSLLFFTSPASLFNGKLLNKALQQVQRGVRAYAMIPFFEYRLKPRSTSMDVGSSYASLSKLAGHFLATDVKHLAIFYEDFVKIRNKSEIVAPLLHTVAENDRKFNVRCHESEELSSCNAHLLQLFPASDHGEKVELLRAPEPLLRVLHSVHTDCERLGRVEQIHCISYTSRSLGTRTQLASLLLSETQLIHNPPPAPD